MAELTLEQKCADGDVFLLSTKVKDKFEYREVPCVVHYGRGP